MGNLKFEVSERANLSLIKPTVAAGAWLRFPIRRPQAKSRLICLHFAGGSAQIFDKLAQHLPDWLEVVSVQLPGRWERSSEKLVTNLSQLMGSLCPEIRSIVDKPYYLLGYSMGAMLGMELITHLKKLDAPMPSGFFAASCVAPQAKFPEFPKNEDDQEFLRKLEVLIGPMPTDFSKSKELMEIFMPILRADIKLVGGYRYKNSDPLGFPIMTLSGKDDPFLDNDKLKLWGELTRSGFRSKILSGGHFFMNDNSMNVVAQEIVLGIEFFTQAGKGTIIRRRKIG